MRGFALGNSRPHGPRQAAASLVRTVKGQVVVHALDQVLGRQRAIPLSWHLMVRGWACVATELDVRAH
eukprot:10089940-Alexandrium_andersonii.AAC.1